MRKTSLVFAAALMVLAGCNTTNPDWGRGPITLSPSVQQVFNRYMGESGAMAFAASTDGRVGFFSYCLDVLCEDAYALTLDGCRRGTGGRNDCKIFADQRDIVWQGKVTMANDQAIGALQQIQNAKFCYDSGSNTYYVVGSRCLIEDDEVSRETYAAGVNASLTAYCRDATRSSYYTANNGCRDGDTAISKQQYDRSRRYCRGSEGADYAVHGACKPSDRAISVQEYRRANAEKAR